MKYHNPFCDLTKFESALWITSSAVVTVSFIISPLHNYLTLAASLTGVTALIFMAKGYVIGQALTIAFSILYGIISFSQRYYGEMLTYLGMSAPAALLSLISWMRHKFNNSKEVKVSSISRTRAILCVPLTVTVTAFFYFILKLLGNANLIVSTISVTTSFVASYLTFCRSPFYALAYASNDIVLIVLWSAACINDISCVPMVLCFVMFLVNDLYAFFNWQRIKKKQNSISEKLSS